jgi:hypothetical protein
MLVRFADHIFLTQNTQTFVWDTAIGMFRPIHTVGWDGYRMNINDDCYTADPMSETYGFGTPEMYKVCMNLTNMYESKVNSPSGVPTSSFLNVGEVVWFRDRPIAFTPCAPKDIQSWKRLVAGHPRTCRRRPANKNKFTKRNL